MENIQKRKKQFFKQFLFRRVDSTPSISFVYFTIVLLNIICDGLVSFQYISMNGGLINLGAYTQFYIEAGLIAGFGFITFLSIFNNFFKYIWIYYVAFLQALTIFYVRTFGICFNKDITTDVCKNNASMQIEHGILFLVFILVMVIFRNNAYYPFQNSNCIFSMRQQNISLCLLIFRLIFGFQTVNLFSLSKDQQIKIILISGFLIFWKSRTSGYLHQLSKKIWDIYYYFIFWVSFSCFVAFYINLTINDNTNMTIFSEGLTFKQQVLYFFCYTFPILVTIPIIGGYGHQLWQKIFQVNDHNFQKIYNKQEVYFICNQLYQKIQNVKKSQMKYRDPEYKKLFKIIKKHNMSCTFPNCSFNEIQDLKQEINDDLHEQKRYLKTLKCCIEFTKLSLQKLKQSYPDNRQVDIEIAYFYLVALKNKQKAMLLYNFLNTKKNKKNNKQKQNQYNYEEKSQIQLSNKKKTNSKKNQIVHHVKQNNFSQAYAVYYLKKKIDSIFVGQQKLTNSNADNQLSEFRQKIQVSVTMLAQFWSLLADPKCNLKKMYDLTNFLFPLKLNLEQDWQKVKLLKNIQIYSIYAKYLIRMFNDKQKGMKIYEQAQKLQLQLKNKQQVELDDKGQDIVDENGIIFLEFDGKNSGVMYQINVNAQKIFGYSKGELLNKKVNDLMPFIYAKQHDRILQNYQQTNYSTMMNKQRFVWGKSKDGFLFPFTILIKPVLSFYSQSSSSQVYANIRKQQCLRQIVGIIIDQNQIVQQFSSSALRLFPQLLQKYQATNKNMPSYLAKSDQQKKLKTLAMLTINELIPQYNQIKQKILHQNQQCQIPIQRIIKTGKNKQESYLQKCIYSISINQITIKIAGKLGFLIKLSKIRQSQFQKIKQPSALNPNTTTNINIGCNLETKSRKQFNQGKNDLNKDYKVQFSLAQQDEAIFMDVKKQKRKYIFSYDLAGKIKDFQVSAKNIQDIRYSKKQLNNKLLSDLQKKKNQSIGIYIPGMTNADSLQTNTMKYVGGYTRSTQILQKYKNQSLNTFKAQLQISEQIYSQNRSDYALGIKTKRLYYNQIKQLRQQEVQLQSKNQLPQQLQQQQSNQLIGQIKPSQLTLILSQKQKNKNITYLRIITIFLLIAVSILSIVQKFIFDNNFMDVYNKTLNIKKLGQIKTQMYGIGFCVNYLTLFAGQDRITYQQLQHNVNQLDQQLDNFIFSSDTNLVYSDGSSEQYYLGFALSKLISEANSLSLFTGLLPPNDSAIFFIKHNTLNSLAISLDAQISLISKNIDQSLDNAMKTYFIFFGAVCAFVLLIMIIKNILLRIIIKKKTQILQVFFQIPRISCSQIQKQCQLFILRLSTDNQEDDMEQEINGEQFQEMGKKNQKVQKKRTIVGQENTTFMFGIVSIVLLVILVAFQLYIISISQINKSSTLTIIKSSKQLLDIQYKILQIATFMVYFFILSQQSINIDRTIPVYNTTNFIQILDKLQKQIKKETEHLRIAFYDLLRILDQQYEVAATSIYYENVCVYGTKCQGSIQQKNGLNSIITKYKQLIKQQSKLTIKYLSTQSSAAPISIKSQQTIKLYQQLTKQNWRKLTKILLQATLRYIEKDKTMNLWVLTALCILNLVVLLIGWMRYYWNLEQKMVATQYILTFIPIDQINKNAKIGKYIKQEILNRK